MAAVLSYRGTPPPGAVLVVGVMAVLACAVPSLRAARIDRVAALNRD